MDQWTSALLTGEPASPTLVSVATPKQKPKKNPYTPSAYYDELAARVKLARKGSKKSTKQVAAELGLEHTNTYQQYEFRTQMPVHLFERFCHVTGADLHWLVTGYYQPMNLQLDLPVRPPALPPAGKKSG